MSFRSNQTLSVWTVEPITHNSICFFVSTFLFFFQRVFLHFDQLKCVVCVCDVLCQEAHASFSYEYTKLELRSVVVAPWVPNVSPSGAASNHFFFHRAPSDGCRHGRTPACFGAIRRAVLSLCYHDAKFTTFSQVNLRLSLLSETQAYKSSDNNPPQASLSTMC